MASRRWRCWRALSYEGVEYELVEHPLTGEQIRIYGAYAGAFSVIHNNLDAALEATNVTGETGTLNAPAKSAARSAFESAKQRFFNHLITAMKTPSLIAAVERDLTAGHAAVIQIVSTGEALMERRLAEIPAEEWNGVQVDITPRERNRPVTLDDALDRLEDPRAMLLVNSQPGRAAVQVPAPSLMLDDGEVERRLRLIRPMEHPAMPLAMMPQTHWREADGETFARAWAAEVAEVPEFTDSEIHLASGLLLPNWKRLPNESTASIGSRPTVASALSAARSRQRGSRTRWRAARRPSRLTPRLQHCSTAGPFSTSRRDSSFAASASWAPTVSN